MSDLLHIFPGEYLNTMIRAFDESGNACCSYRGSGHHLLGSVEELLGDDVVVFVVGVCFRGRRRLCFVVGGVVIESVLLLVLASAFSNAIGAPSCHDQTMTKP